MYEWKLVLGLVAICALLALIGNAAVSGHWSEVVVLAFLVVACGLAICWESELLWARSADVSRRNKGCTEQQ